MSGGCFDYNQWRITEIADILEDYIYGHSLDEEEIKGYIKDRWLEDEEKEYIKKNKHTIPNRYEYIDILPLLKRVGFLDASV